MNPENGNLADNEELVGKLTEFGLSVNQAKVNLSVVQSNVTSVDIMHMIHSSTGKTSIRYAQTPNKMIDNENSWQISQIRGGTHRKSAR